MAASPDIPRCRRCRRPLRTEASQSCGLGARCLRLLRRRRRRLRVAAGLPPISAYRTGAQIPGQTVIPLDDRTLT
jgi:hypothetical protein